MPPIQSRTREDIRLAVGYNLQAVFEGSTTSASAGTSDLIDTKLKGGTDEHNGKWVIITSGARDGDISQVTAYVSATNTLTVSPVFGGTLASGVTYELWEREFRPQAVHNWINQAIDYASTKTHDPEEDVSIHLHPERYRYAIPSGFAAGISKLERRISVKSVQIDPCESGWTEQTNVTQVFDTTIKKQGSASVRLVIAAAAGAGDIIGLKNITSLDLSSYDMVEFWLLTSVSNVAGDFRFFIYTGATPTLASTSNIPAATANAFTYMRISLTADTARALGAVTRIAIENQLDPGARTLWLDDIKAVVNDGAQWVEIPHEWWWIDLEAQEIVFKPEWGAPPYELLRITGGDIPALLSADSTVCEIDPYFVIAKATELGLIANAQFGSPPEEAAWRGRMAYWAGEATRRMRSFPMRQNWRDTR